MKFTTGISVHLDWMDWIVYGYGKVNDVYSG